MYLNKGQVLLVSSPREDWQTGKQLKNKIVVVRSDGECDRTLPIYVDYKGIKNDILDIGIYTDEFMVLK